MEFPYESVSGAIDWILKLLDFLPHALFMENDML